MNLNANLIRHKVILTFQVSCFQTIIGWSINQSKPVTPRRHWLVTNVKSFASEVK